MFRDRFKARYTTIPFAIHKEYSEKSSREVITHQHKEVEIILMTDGSVDFYINSHLYRIEDGDALIISPYDLHRACIPNTQITSYYCICFDAELLCDAELKAYFEGTNKHIVSKDHESASLIQRYITDAFVACENNETGWELCAVGSISLLFGILKKDGFFSMCEKNENDEKFGKSIMTYIIANYATDVTSRDAANALYVSHGFFCRLFKKNFGCCFSEYLLAYRIEKAKLYLTNTAQSVTDIAFRTGFNDCSYFCKAFKEHVGTTPLSYRREIRRGDK